MSPREHGTLEWIDGHEFSALTNFLGNTRVPVLDFDKDALAIVVTRVADIERPAGVPIWRPGPTANMARCELARYLLDNVLERMFRKVAYKVTLCTRRG